MAAPRSKQAPHVSAFISHAKADSKKAEAIAEGLEARGFKCWIAPRDVRAGRSYGDEIIRGIESAKTFILVLSKASNASAFVAREVERAVSKNKPVLAVRIANVQPGPALELFVASTQWIDAFPGRLAPHIGRLADRLAEEEGVEPTAPSDEHGTPKPAARWLWPAGAAASVLIALGAGIALWPGNDHVSDSSRSTDPALITTPTWDKPEVQAIPQQAAVEEPHGEDEMIGGGKTSSADRNPQNSAAGAGLAGRDLDFQACETASGDAALAACDRAIASGKFAGRNLSYLYSDRGFMRMRKGEIDLALADLDVAVRIDSTNFYAFWNRGAVYTAKGDLERARSEFTTALALNPDKTSKAKIEEALNVVVAAAKAVEAPPPDPSVLSDPSRFWGSQEGVAGSSASSYPTDAMPSLTPAMPAAPMPASPAAPPPQ